jgi:hypothetical protein
VRLLLVPDSSAVRPPGRIALFSCNDVDRGMTERDLRYSPLLEGIRGIVSELGLQQVNLTHPFAVFRSAQVAGGTITLNYRTVLLRLTALLLRPLGRHRQAAARERLEVGLYRRLLQRLRPEIVFSIQPPFAMCQAARQVGVRVVEALHGTNISLSDRVFSEHMANPDRMLPHVVLAFDDVTYETYTTLCAGRETEVLRATDPWLHACRRQSGRWARPPGSTTGKRILVTLQWGYDGEREALANIVPNGVVHPALEAAIAAAAQRGITIWLRLHPIQMNLPGYRHHVRCVQTLARSHAHVEFELATALPLPLLLEEASGHITMSSSSVGEAAVAGVPSLMLCPTLHAGGAHDGMFRELEIAGHVTFGQLDANAIVAWMERCPTRSIRPGSADDIQRRHQAQLGFYSNLIEAACAAHPAPRLDWCEDLR